MACLLSGDSRTYLPRVFSEESISEDRSCQVGNIWLSFFPTLHPVEGYSVRLEGRGWTMAYSSDTSPSPALLEAAAGVDLFICEATMPASHAREASHGHLTSVQAAEAAEEAGVKSLMLTHIWPTFEMEDILNEAKEIYKGELALAREGLSVYLGGGSHAQG
jgi:ribonuclease BN (tRNA processing enzyme)